MGSGLDYESRMHISAPKAFASRLDHHVALHPCPPVSRSPTSPSHKQSAEQGNSQAAVHEGGESKAAKLQSVQGAGLQYATALGVLCRPKTPRSNEKEISHGRGRLQTRLRSLDQGPLASSSG